MRARGGADAGKRRRRASRSAPFPYSRKVSPWCPVSAHQHIPQKLTHGSRRRSPACPESPHRCVAQTLCKPSRKGSPRLPAGTHRQFPGRLTEQLPYRLTLRIPEKLTLRSRKVSPFRYFRCRRCGMRVSACSNTPAERPARGCHRSARQARRECRVSMNSRFPQVTESRTASRIR